jgi:hypothetical protein
MVRNLRSGPLRTSIVMLLATVAWSVSAQTAARNENLNEEISKLRACARAHAPEAQAAGVRTPNEAANYFFKACIPVLGLILMGSDADQKKRLDDDPKEGGALTPGKIRIAFREEWAAFIERTDKR